MGGCGRYCGILYCEEENMRLRVPSYYKKFHCIAGACQDSCCIGWEIDIDEDTFSYYKSVEGAFGERLRAHMVTEDVNSFALQENGWCPFLNREKLCDICIALGEEALSEVCTEFPRFTMEYEDVREKVLSLSCEEVGRLVFSTDEKITWEEHELPDDLCMEMDAWDDGEMEESDAEMDAWDDEAADVPAEQLEAVREQALAILQNRRKPIFERAAEYLSYCKRMQQELYGGMMTAGQAQRKTERTEQELSHQAYQDFLARMESYERLEVLDGTWEEVKRALYDTFSEKNYRVAQQEFVETYREREYEYEHLLVYFTNRYFMRAYYDDNILTKAQFAIVSVLMIRDMDVARYLLGEGKYTLEDRIDTAKIYAKEVEHSEENMELLAEDFQFEEVFCVERLLEQLA